MVTAISNSNNNNNNKNNNKPCTLHSRNFVSFADAPSCHQQTTVVDIFISLPVRMLVGLYFPPVTRIYSWRIKIHPFSCLQSGFRNSSRIFLSVQTSPDLPQLTALKANSNVQRNPLVPQLSKLSPLSQPGRYHSFLPGGPVSSLVNIATSIPPREHRLSLGKAFSLLVLGRCRATLLTPSLTPTQSR